MSAHPSMNAKITPELQEMAELVGDFMQYWGFKKVHGRIWTHLFLSDTPLDAAELIRRLKISKALVSISVAELLKYEVILEAGKSAHGTLLYSANPDAVAVILNVLRQRERRMMSRIHASYQLLSKLSAKDRAAARLEPKRIDALGFMISTADACLESVVQLEPVELGSWSRFKDLATLDSNNP